MALGFFVPYTSTIKPSIKYIGDNFVAVDMLPRCSIRNHLGTTHATALATLGELNAALAMLKSTEKDFTIIGLDAVYVNPGKGLMKSTAEVKPNASRGIHRINSYITDEKGKAIASVLVVFKVW